jgi:ribonuclease Z
MRPTFHPRLIHDPSSDPGLYIPFQHRRRALLFDAGDLSPLPPRDRLKVTHVFVTHTHMDHFVGFDALLRTFLGRAKTLHLFGPPGFFANVEGKLAGYTWNLVGEYENDLVLKASEVHPKEILTETYSSGKKFRPSSRVSSRAFSGVLLEEASFSVRGILLDHRTPCLGLALTETVHVNIIREGLNSMGLPVGPWLNNFKAAVHEGRDPNREFTIHWKTGAGTLQERRVPLGELVQKIAVTGPGQKFAYITDVIASPENSEKIVDLATGADLLFVEAAFLESEWKQARRKYHLTAGQAGELAGLARVKRFRLFHFSPRYRNRAADFEREAQERYRSVIG